MTQPQPWSPRELRGLRYKHEVTDHDRTICPICRFIATLDNISEAMAGAAIEMTITVDVLASALHKVRHPKGDLWRVNDRCGCIDYATQIIENLPSPESVVR